jgi:hypothetical protein
MRTLRAFQHSDFDDLVGTPNYKTLLTWRCPFLIADPGLPLLQESHELPCACVFVI